MRVVAFALLLLASVAAPAHAERPQWGTPGPRQVGDVAGFPRPRFASGENPFGARPAPQPRDARVTLVREAVEIRVLRNLIAVETRLALRAPEGVTAWEMVLPEAAHRTPGVSLRFVEVTLAGAPLRVRHRFAPTAGGRDAYWSWRVDLPPGVEREVAVRFVAPARWVPADRSGRPIRDGDIGSGWALPVHYDRTLAERYAARGPTTVTLRTAGFAARVRRPGPRGALVDLGVSVEDELLEERALSLFVGWPSIAPPPPATEADGVEPWLALLEQGTDAFGVSPPAFPRLIERLRAAAEDGDPRSAEVARGLLDALRARLADEGALSADVASWLGATGAELASGGVSVGEEMRGGAPGSGTESVAGAGAATGTGAGAGAGTATGTGTGADTLE
ncbi:MAG TPA: hypothetical protein DEF51_37610 [Myxococcales bacterium]|nr:hypothetical protein [Myxococcales bacterium]